RGQDQRILDQLREQTAMMLEPAPLTRLVIGVEPQHILGLVHQEAGSRAAGPHRCERDLHHLRAYLASGISQSFGCDDPQATSSGADLDDPTHLFRLGVRLINQALAVGQFNQGLEDHTASSPSSWRRIGGTSITPPCITAGKKTGRLGWPKSISSSIRPSSM